MFAAELVRRLRIEKGIPPTALAAAVGVSERQLSRYENGEIEPRLTTAGLWADALGVSIDSLIVHDPEAMEASVARGEVA